MFTTTLNSYCPLFTFTGRHTLCDCVSMRQWTHLGVIYRHHNMILAFDQHRTGTLATASSFQLTLHLRSHVGGGMGGKHLNPPRQGHTQSHARDGIILSTKETAAFPYRKSTGKTPAMAASTLFTNLFWQGSGWLISLIFWLDCCCMPK